MRRRINQPDWTKPVCNLDGSYREYQCEAYSRSKCWCVYDNGMMIPGTEKDLHDANVEYHNLNCAEAKSNAPPAPHPPPVSSPFTDTRIGWHLAYRDAYFRCPSPCYSPCPCQPGQQYYNPYYPAHVVNSAPVRAPVPAPAPLPAPARAPIYYPYDPYAATYTAPYQGSCPDPCPEPCPCQRSGKTPPSEEENTSSATGSGDEKDVTSEGNEDVQD
nr:uncharacterized protein LOC131794122 [Pocillopora verrucosa]